MTRRFGLEPRPAAEMLQYTQEARPGEAFCPLPPPTGAAPYRMTLASLGVTDPTDQLVFHVIGDHGGIKDPNPQRAVAAALIADLGASPSFLYSVGDDVYFNGDASEYFAQFYEPYDSYTRPIVAIPGNHDGDNSDNPAVRSLDAFVRNFCAASPVHSPDADDAHRDAMTQPNVYWTFECALATIVGLYTNVPSGGVIEADQQAWLAGELADAPKDRALIIALHHPPYSVDAHHGGSAAMGNAIDDAVAQAGRKPDLVLAGHVHNAQRFTRLIPDYGQVPYIVCGNGGYHNLHGLASDAVVGQQVPGSDVVFEAGDDKHWGFLRLTITPQTITGQTTAVSGDGTTAISDRFSLDLAAHRVT